MRDVVSQYGFRAGVILLNLALALYATPVVDYADASVYLGFSRQLLGEPVAASYVHVSPLYPIILAGWSFLFSPPALYKLIVFFQYGLLAISTILVYRLFERIFARRKLAAVTALLFNLSLTTIYFSNILMTEILTVFLFLSSLTILLKINEGRKVFLFALLGLVVGALVLARYNTLPLLLTYVFLLGVLLFRHQQPWRSWFLPLGAFLMPLLLVVNAWCSFNYVRNGFYGLFPNAGQGISRNIIVASIRPDDVVSSSHQPVLEIFLEAREAISANPPERRKGSMAGLDKFGILSGLYDGYRIYQKARPDLKVHYQLPEDADELDMAARLAGFYREIVAQNQGFLLKYRFFSFFNGFRAAAHVLPESYGKINLYFLPAVVIVAYKLGFLFCSFVTFLFFFPFIRDQYRHWSNLNFPLLVFFLMVFSFWGINFLFIAEGNANRYKFPADPLIIGLGVFYTHRLIAGWLSRWRITSASDASRQARHVVDTASTGT